MRSFEVAAMGACMLAEYTEEHRGILGDVPQVPLADRPDRFKFDLTVFLVVHFG